MDLSDDGDDFDNFFGTKKSKKPKSSVKIFDPMDDLFGIEDTKIPAARKQVFSANKPLTPKKPLNDEDEVDDDDDDDLGFDPKKPKSAVGKLNNLLDDLLLPLETKRSQTAGPAAAAGPSKPPAISRQSTDTTTDTSNILSQTPQRPKTSQGRRSSNMSMTMQNPDPLGLFKGKGKDTALQAPKDASTPAAKKRGTTADWLGLSVEPTEVVQDQETDRKSQTTSDTPKSAKVVSAKESSPEVLELPEETPLEEDPRPDNNNLETKIKNVSSESFDTTAHGIMLMNTLNLEAKQNFTNLKYQEQQIIMATQMRQQEKVLMEMQMKQDSLLQNQERQFQNLLQQQMQRHQQLEELIKHQQQRINNHLQLMMVQPPLMNGIELENSGNSSQKLKDSKESLRELETREEDTKLALDLIQYEADNKRLELENVRLEELIANTKSSYEREIELMEKSYKKQIEVLERQLDSLERRLKLEIEELQNHYQSKIDYLEQEKYTQKKNYEEDILSLKQDHEDELRRQRKNNEESLEMIKEEHHRMLDSIRQAKMLEFAAVQENGSYLQCLKQASDNLSDLTGGLQDLKENMKEKIDILHMEREKKLEAREKHLEDCERRMKIIEESNELEKQRLMELVSTLELQMSKLSRESAEDNWQLRQKLASLDAEKMAFIREREFFRDQLLRDEERIKDLKEIQLQETQKLQLQIQEERSQLHVEKSKFEMEKRLHTNTDMQKEKMEVEASMKVAQDAVRKADMERERYYKMQRQLEQQKRELNDKEHSLTVKEEELHQELMSYRMAERLSQELQQKAKIAEQFYQNKVQMLQQRTQEIAEKESNLSQERLLLAQDRIALHALKTKLSQQTKCSLCQLSQKNKEISESLNGNVSNTMTNDLAHYHLRSGLNDQFEYATQLDGGNVVERLLDANIADSLRKMNASTHTMGGWEMLLDDDHKKMVQNNNVDGSGGI